MITEYHRPKTLAEALKLLSLPGVIPLGGGTVINTPLFKDKEFAVVDLQDLNLNYITLSDYTLNIGATATLQQLLESPNSPEALKQAIQREAALNIRNAATVAGTLVSAGGRSAFATAMLALDAKLDIRYSNTESRISSFGEFLALRPQGLITLISIPVNVKFAYEQVARTPADLPIVCAALALWNSGRTRLALGGTGKNPLLAMDGTESDGLESAAKNAFHESNDQWASAEYRMDVAATLANRCLQSASM